MHPYTTIRLTEYPDVADICNDGRATHVGRVQDGREDHGYLRSKHRRAVRRQLKRADKARSLRVAFMEFE